MPMALTSRRRRMPPNLRASEGAAARRRLGRRSGPPPWCWACSSASSAKPGARELLLRGVALVGLEVWHRVDRMAAPVPLAEPELEVEVAGGRVTGLPDDADLLAGLDHRALGDRGAGREVRVHVVLVQLLVADDDVVAGGALVAHPLDLGAADRHERRAAGGHDVLALVGVTGAGSADTVAEGVCAGDREDHRSRGRGGGGR